MPLCLPDGEGRGRLLAAAVPTEGWHSTSTNGDDRLCCLQHPARTTCCPHCFCPLTETSFLPTSCKHVFQGARSTKEARTRAVSWKAVPAPVRAWLSYSPETGSRTRASVRPWPHFKWPGFSLLPRRVSPTPKSDAAQTNPSEVYKVSLS